MTIVCHIHLFYSVWHSFQLLLDMDFRFTKACWHQHMLRVIEKAHDYTAIVSGVLSEAKCSLQLDQ